MPEYLLLRLEAPLMSFGGHIVDNFGANDSLPGLSMLTGLIGNALGYRHGDHERLGRLQDAISFAARVDRYGARVMDYHTVSLGQEHLAMPGWTTRGRTEVRAGGKSSTGTLIRHRPYWADRIVTLCLHAAPVEGAPSLTAIERALKRPERPLFIGRKPCIPGARIARGRVEASSLRAALEAVPRPPRASSGPLLARWPVEAPDDGPSVGRRVWTSDTRDWREQVHVGRRGVWEGTVDPPQEEAS